ncbi:MAG: molybdopterin dinucleotide binding domain-containing protein, partial [Pseudomonadota bacterium]
PVVSLPEADGVADALRACDFTVVSDLSAETDTARLADVVLPATGWGEKDGTVTNSDRTISRQRPALPVPGRARADWAIFADVGQRMGWCEAFDYQTPAEIFREHAALSGVAAGFGRDFDISALANLSDRDYEALVPVRWPISTACTDGRFFGDGRFFTETGRARFVPVRQGAPATRRSPRYPYRLNTGRVRDQWHTMTRTAKAPRLSTHLAEPFLQLHPKDAAALGLGPADIARVESPTACALLRVLITEDVAPGHPFAPMHWTAETAPAARIGPLVAAKVDPVSGQPESKASVVAVSRFDAAWHAFAISERALRPDCAYWARMRTSSGWRAELAGAVPHADWTTWAADLFGLDGEPEVISDSARNTVRLAYRTRGRLSAALFVAPGPVEVARDFVVTQIGQTSPDILAARPSAGRPDPGPVVCSCMAVGRNTILDALREAGPDLDRICTRTGAGTNCGSCRPEIADLISRSTLRTAAE